MAEFNELIKNFDKVRDYTRDFFIYGFKHRADFNKKSLRTYDNEKRRIEGYLSEHMNRGTSKRGKNIYISLDSSKIAQNPLYAAWKAKSFTDNDIMLHFYILDILKMSDVLNINDLTEKVCDKSGIIFDTQTVRIKANEYVKEGILICAKYGKTYKYGLSNDYLNTLESYDDLLTAVKFYQEIVTFGVVGSYILDNETAENDIFKFKHHFIVHTLEDGVLFQIIKAINEKREIKFINESVRLRNAVTVTGVPLKVFVSQQSGRRYICIYQNGRFTNYRLDYVKKVETLEVCGDYDTLKGKLHNNLDKCWGVSFGAEKKRPAEFKMRLSINEKSERHIINRLEREGRGGTVERVEENVYEYTKEMFDVNECMTWVKSFIGRIISIEGADKLVYNRFLSDICRMHEYYCKEADE